MIEPRGRRELQDRRGATEPQGDPLLDAAERMLDEPSRGTASAWPRAAALVLLGSGWRRRSASRGELAYT